MSYYVIVYDRENVFHSKADLLSQIEKEKNTKENSKFLVYFLNFPVFTGFPAHQHLCNLHFSLIFSLVRNL